MPLRPRDPDLKAIGSAVRMRRAELGLRQIELSERANVSERTVQIIEAGGYRARLSTYGRLAIALEVPLADLLESKGERCAT